MTFKDYFYQYTLKSTPLTEEEKKDFGTCISRFQK